MEKDFDNVQLGLVQQAQNILFQVIDWETWDGGEIGGRPVRQLSKNNF